MALIMSNEAIFYSITGKKKIELVLGRNGNMSSLFQSQTIFAVQTFIGASCNGSICFLKSWFIFADLGLQFSLPIAKG